MTCVTSSTAARSAWLRSSSEVAGVVAQVREPAADALRRREAVQPVGAGAVLELAQQLARRGRAAGKRLARVVAEPLGEPVPVRGQLPRHRVQLPQRAVLGGEQALGGRLAHWLAPGSHSGSSPEPARFAPRERMKSRSDSRLR